MVGTGSVGKGQEKVDRVKEETRSEVPGQGTLSVRSGDRRERVSLSWNWKLLVISVGPTLNQSGPDFKTRGP